MEIPHVLHHYTNIETLALILKNKTIRFNSLEKMDDLQEKQAFDAKHIGKITFVSSWTEIEKESIPMWNMYASLKAGVRISMVPNPFKLREVDEDIMSVVPASRVFKEANQSFKVLIPFAEMVKGGFIVAPNNLEQLLFKVEYTDDSKKLNPRVLLDVGDGTTINFEAIGKYKNKSWEFQQEWRYLLRIQSHDLLADPGKQNEEMLINAEKLLRGNYESPIPYYDMQISEQAFSDMKITVSPQISAGNRVIVHDLIEKYNPKAEIRESELYGLI